MSKQRHLQKEIDSTLKKVQEGVEVFDDLWAKLLRSEVQQYEGTPMPARSDTQQLCCILVIVIDILDGVGVALAAAGQEGQDGKRPKEGAEEAAEATRSDPWLGFQWRCQGHRRTPGST